MEIQSALAHLERVCGIQPTLERESLCGSAYKRLALVEGLAEDTVKEHAAIEAMRKHYANAEDLARETGQAELFYPALNALWAELIVDAPTPGWAGFTPPRLATVRASLDAKEKQAPDFWSYSGAIELEVIDAIAQCRIAEVAPQIGDKYDRLHVRIPSPQYWRSTRDQLRFFLTARRDLADSERAAIEEMLRRFESFASAAVP